MGCGGGGGGGSGIGSGDGIVDPFYAWEYVLQCFLVPFTVLGDGGGGVNDGGGGSGGGGVGEGVGGGAVLMTLSIFEIISYILF